MKVGVFHWHSKQTWRWNLSERPWMQPILQTTDPLAPSRLTAHTASTCCCGCSVTESCPALSDPMDCSTPGLPVLHYLQEFAQTHVHGVGDAIQPSHSLPPLFPPTFNLSQHQVFSNELALCIRWPKYWSLSLNEYSGFVSSRIDQFYLLVVQGTLRSLLQYHNLKASILQCSAFFYETYNISQKPAANSP